MHRQNLVLYSTNHNTLRTVIRTTHGRILYWELARSGEQFLVSECFYLDRVRNGNYYATPHKQTTKSFNVDSVLEIVSTQLDRTYYGVEINHSLAELSTEAFISHKLNEFKKGYNFLIFVGKGNSVNGLPHTLTTRLANRIHRKIYLRIRYYKDNLGAVEAFYYDRRYKSRLWVIPQMLTTVFVAYDHNSIIELVNRELNCDFTDIIIADDSIDVENNEAALCGCI